ncbi:MAG: hypothetical protein JO332_15590 [Planctomycetaceae bacterium]|nr:hypothetical protein [Planctomycetaceae bacterium]
MMSLDALRIAAVGGQALLRRMDAISAGLAEAAAGPRAPQLGKTSEGLLTLDGEVVEPPVAVPSFITDLTLDPDGLVTGIDPESPGVPMPIGQIEPRPSAAPRGLDPMRALMDLVALQRAFELNNKVLQAADDVLQGINTLRRKP